MRQATPDLLYKYLSPERIDVLTGKRIRFTQPVCFNDPFEFRPGTPQQDGGLGHFEEKMAKRGERDFRAMALQYGVLALAQKNDSIPMWAHYADSHRGFVIGFDVSKEPFKKAIEDGRLQAVSYQQHRASHTRGLPDKTWVDAESILLTKGKDWEPEGEWRWIENGDPNDYAKVMPGRRGELLYLRPVPPGSIRQIILGCRSDLSLRSTIESLKLTKDYSHVEIFQADLSPDRYRLMVGPL